MKKLNLITTLLALLIVLFGCKKETPKETPTCSFVYSAWTSCSNSIQTRTYTSSPSGCTGTPPADSIQRPCSMLITIGNQIWATKNLDVATYRNGDPIPQAQDENAWKSLTTGAWCYYENNTANGTIYGKLYNWYAVNDPRGLAPTGYHIPTDAEWTSLTTYLGGETGAGKKMKSTAGWVNNGNGNNTSGFTGLPGGTRNYTGGFGDVGASGKWWSSSEYDTNTAWYRNLGTNSDNVFRYHNVFKVHGFSVRCLRD